MFPEFTNAKISSNHKLLQASSPLWLVILIPIFFLMPVPPSKPLHQSFHSMLPIQTNLPRLHQHNNERILNYTFSMSLTDT